MANIAKIAARQILDSRGFPTVQTDATLEDGSIGRASVPSGASTGSYEAVELRDGDQSHYNGQSVMKAVANIHEVIAPATIGHEAADQQGIDRLMIDMDGTPNKGKLGANAILSVSLAVAVAQAKSQNLELFQYLDIFSPRKDQPFLLPTPMCNVVNGGKHALGASDFQEYMIIPKNSGDFAEKLRAASEIFQALKKILKQQGFQTTVGDEGGFAPALSSNTKPIEIILEAIRTAGYEPGKNIFLGMDFAASEFFQDGKYNLAAEGKILSTDEMILYCEAMAKQYPIISMEDPLVESDFAGWARLTAQIGSTMQIVGDDLYVTNTQRLKTGIEQKSSNAILIKLNQIGTLTETVEAISLAYKNGMNAVISHRSGETEDTFIADFAVAMRTGQIKTGSLSRSERLAKYNRLLQIEEILKK